jgi:hypothetical protein
MERPTLLIFKANLFPKIIARPVAPRLPDKTGEDYPISLSRLGFSSTHST